MNRLLPVLLLLLPVLSYGRKQPPLPDSFTVAPGRSACIDFETDYVGELQKRDSMSWTFKTAGMRKAESFGLQFKTAVQHPKTLFEDCFLFEPVRQACVEEKDEVFIGTHFFIRPAGETYAHGGTVPASVRFYADTSALKPMFTGNCLSSDKFPAEKTTHYLRPFYFRKYEVTNVEYREFVHWVQDSIVRTRLGYFLPNGKLDRQKKYDLYDRRTDSIVNLRLPIEKRHFDRNQTDAGKLNYRFTNRPDGYAADTVNIYPDTLAWTDDFTFSFNEPMANMYFWHPAYDHYPVAGITYWQCLAFLEWKTNQLQAQLNKKGIRCKVKCNLPSELEWDYASTAELNKEGHTTLVGRYYTGTCDYSWLTDLRLLRYTDKDEKVFVFKEQPDDTQQSGLYTPRKKQTHFMVFADDFDKPLRRMDLDDEKTWGDFIYDGFFHTGPAQLNSDGVPSEKTKHKATVNERTKAHYDAATGICWMDGNVSEWMREDVSQWRGIFAKHRLVVNGPYEEERRLLLDYETYYFDQLPAHAKLVRGSNWYDERFAMKYGKNVGGLQAKTFCNPDSAHCTLGFRYVIYLEEK